MPTYDYACEACGHHWDVEQRMSEDAIRKCPKCKKLKARRQITGGNFILKGSGWYADLYSSSKPAAKKSSEGGSSSVEAKSETKSESAGKSEGKSEGASKSESVTASKPEAKSASKKKD